jgi:hypothetical protein
VRGAAVVGALLVVLFLLMAGWALCHFGIV